MKRLFLAIIVLVHLVPMEMMADGYTTLWKQVQEAQQKDLPQTQIQVLDKIIVKATTDKSYGHLLKAQLAKASAQTMVSPDSMDVFVNELKNAERKAAENNPVLAAVYQSVLGRIYRDSPNMGDDQQQVSKDYYAQSMSNPALLASQVANGYEPMVLEGTDSKIFYNDLLHVLGFEAGDYQAMHDYYLSHNNRPAACLCALKLLQKQRYVSDTQMRKSKYMQSLDSLLNTYGDLREAGELAIERYNFMDEAEDASAEDKMNYINYALILSSCSESLAYLVSAVLVAAVCIKTLFKAGSTCEGNACNVIYELSIDVLSGTEYIQSGAGSGTAYLSAYSFLSLGS